MQLVDSHCHLNFKDYAGDLDAVVERARAAGVGVMQTICTELAELDEILAISAKYSGIFCSVGVHPNDSGKSDIPRLADLTSRAAHPRIIGIGETGLDYYYETADRATQQASFRVHIQAAQATGLPIIVHTRDADDDTIALLTTAMREAPFTGVIHCFTSSRQLAEKMLEIGFYISISGIASFKNAVDIRETIKIIPLNRLLVETDAPFLAPVPHRGKRNEPAFVRHVNDVVAELKAITPAECAAITTENFFRLFNKARLI